MSARVFNPMVMSEMRRMLRGGVSENGQHVLGPDEADLARVRRNLFGNVDHEENGRFVESELAAQQKRDAELYEFDFVRGVPYPNSRRYVWEKVDEVPEPYALRRLPYLRDHAAIASASVQTETVTAAVVRESAAEKQVSGTSANAVVITKTKQSSICDFMKSRKRSSNSSTATTAAKLSATDHTSNKLAKKSLS
ncbi:uncharacterized protein dap [Anabrus simplex]|uniref:uncharacterized protein dap n=1 Tax=Anabrus simplex TaxID=316456 RepID=UPI0035A3D020